MGKHHRAPFKESASSATEVCSIIHTDLCGPIETKSIGGASYMLLFKDDYSPFCVVYFLKSKTEISEYFSKFLSLSENQTGKKVKLLRSDNGTEFVNSEMRKIMERRGIEAQTTVPYRPEQNGELKGNSERSWKQLAPCCLRRTWTNVFGQKQLVQQHIYSTALEQVVSMARHRISCGEAKTSMSKISWLRLALKSGCTLLKKRKEKKI